MRLICIKCGGDFTALNKKRKYCSRKCFHESRENKDTRKCTYCGKDITRRIGNFRKNQRTYFCDNNCKGIWEQSHKTRFWQLKDIGWCRTMYQNHSLSEIARSLGCGESTVYKRFKEHGLELSRSFSLSRYEKTEKHKNNISKGKLGKQTREDNPNWKGGITKFTLSIRSSKRYVKWKKEVLKNREKVCELCGTTERLEVDHVKRFKDILLDNNVRTLEDAYNCDELWDTENGRILCRGCNIGRETNN